MPEKMQLDFGKIVEESLAGCYIHDEEGKIVYVNDIVAVATKYSKEELIGKNILELAYEGDAKKAVEILETSRNKPFTRSGSGERMGRYAGYGDSAGR